MKKDEIYSMARWASWTILVLAGVGISSVCMFIVSFLNLNSVADLLTSLFLSWAVIGFLFFFGLKKATDNSVDK